jgi:hypothetical protein
MLDEAGRPPPGERAGLPRSRGGVYLMSPNGPSTCPGRRGPGPRSSMAQAQTTLTRRHAAVPGSGRAVAGHRPRAGAGGAMRLRRLSHAAGEMPGVWVHRHVIAEIEGVTLAAEAGRSRPRAVAILRPAPSGGRPRRRVGRPAPPPGARWRPSRRPGADHSRALAGVAATPARACSGRSGALPGDDAGRLRRRPTGSTTPACASSSLVASTRCT